MTSDLYTSILMGRRPAILLLSFHSKYGQKNWVRITDFAGREKPLEYLLVIACTMQINIGPVPLFFNLLGKYAQLKSGPKHCVVMSTAKNGRVNN